MGENLKEPIGRCLPCPFCGRDSGFTMCLENGAGYNVVCSSCDAQGPRELTREECWSSWDKRFYPKNTKDSAKNCAESFLRSFGGCTCHQVFLNKKEIDPHCFYHQKLPILEACILKYFPRTFLEGYELGTKDALESMDKAFEKLK